MRCVTRIDAAGLQRLAAVVDDPVVEGELLQAPAIRVGDFVANEPHGGDVDLPVRSAGGGGAQHLACDGPAAALRPRADDARPESGVAQEIQQWVSSILVERDDDDEGEIPEGPEEDLPTEGDLPEGAEKGTFGRGLIRGRTEAYQQLSEIADYLAVIEPHSPTPFLIRRAVSWGGMTMTELLEDLVRNESDLRAIYDLLGVDSRH